MKNIMCAVLVSLSLPCSVLLHWKGTEDGNRIQREVSQSRIQKRAEKLFSCYNTAQEHYSRSWNLTCKILTKEDECSLPPLESNGLDSDRRADMSACRETVKTIYGN